MRLLVSVRSALEVAPAVAGGAEIVDAKEPSAGSLGAVSLPALRAIARRLPPGMPLSVALGDPADVAAVARAIASLDELEPRPVEAYVKLGLAAAGDLAGARALVAGALESAGRSTLRPAVIVVAYADHERAGTPAPWIVSRLAASVGARGVLLDTYLKDGRDLFRHIGEAELAEWIADARGAGLLVALAGSLSVDGVRRAADLPAHIVGVRGAACDGGREGHVTEERVRALESVLRRECSPPA
jgi:uncharacterized protein (UPF0264 family)